MDAETMTNEQAAQTLEDILQCTPNLRPNDEAAMKLAIAALHSRAKMEPRAWMRRWAYEGEAEYKERDERTGRMRIARKFMMLKVTPNRIFNTDVPLFTSPSPDHVEALAKLSDSWRKRGRHIRGITAGLVRETVYRCANELDAALTRYKESRNG
jgi:hypothetical protein